MTLAPGRPFRSLTTTVFALAGSTLAVTASALPPVFDRVPEGAMVTIAVPNLGKFEKNMTNLGTMLGAPGGMGLEQVMMMLGIEKGVNMDGSLGLVIMPPTEGAMAPAPNVVMLLPTTNLADFVGNFGAEAKPGDASVAVNLMGDEFFAKDAGGGYTIVGKAQAVVDAFSAKPGSAGAFKKLLGPKAEAMADTADFVVVVNTAVARPIVEKAMVEQMNNEEAAGPMGQIPAEAKMLLPVITSTFFQSTSTVAAAFSADTNGVSLDLAATFLPNAPAAKFFAKPGNASALMGKLPAGSFLLAGAIDVSNPELKALVTELAKNIPQDGMPAEQKQMVTSMVDGLGKADGFAGTIGFNPGGIGMGLLTQTVSFTQTKDPKSAVGMLQTQIDAVTKTGQGTGKIEPGAADVNGVKVDTYELKVNPDENNPMIAQVMSGLYGPSGAQTGYLAPVDGGLITTFSKSKTLMASALAAATKGENTLGASKQVAAVAGKLPKGRVAEAYLGTKGVLDTVKPFLGMISPEVAAIEVPKDLPPIGFALSPSDNTLQATIYLPIPVLKLVAEIGQKAAAARGGMGPADEEEGGQPNF
jgi:hypothetical protein